MLMRIALLLSLTILPQKEAAPASTPESRVSALVRRSQAVWDGELERVRLDFQADPARVLRALVDQLDDGAQVMGLPEESSFYSVCGNALTALEDLTDLRLDDVDRDWIGFRVHDHRSARPGEGAARACWQAWLRTREGLSVERWFHGLAARELFVLQRLLRTPNAKWTDAELAPARALGARANPFLLDALLDSEWACEGERVADQANRVLARVNGGEAESVERHALLSIDPKDPLRADGTALVRNRLALLALRERWSVRLFPGK